MRWMLIALLVAGCTDDRADVPTTIVSVHLEHDCGDCYEQIDLWPLCGYDLTLIEPDTRDVNAYTSLAPSEVTSLVQLQYAGTTDPDAQLQLDYIMGGQTTVADAYP